jgi:hypothetical protein
MSLNPNSEAVFFVDFLANSYKFDENQIKLQIRI